MDQQEKKTIFRKESLDRISSPDQLDTYIHVTSISVYVLLAAIIVLLAAFFVWSATCTLPSTVTCKGIASDGVITCFMSEESVANVKPGTECTVGSELKGIVQEVSASPLSLKEASAELDDYSIYMLDLGDWNYKVTVTSDHVADGFTTVTIITGVIRPIDFFIS